MRSKERLSLRGLVILFSFLIIISCAFGGLSLIWLRQQVSVSAGRCIALERVVLTAERYQIDLETKIAEASSPEGLRRRLSKDFSFPGEQRVVWVQGRKQDKAIAAKVGELNRFGS